MNHLSIGKRIALLMLAAGLLLLTVAGIAWRNQSNAVAALQTVYEDRTVPLHLDNFNKRRAEITATWDKYMTSSHITPEEKELAEALDRSVARFRI